jgi:hypothetical protein
MAEIIMYSVSERDARNMRPENEQMSFEQRSVVEQKVKSFEKKVGESLKENERARSASALHAERHSQTRFSI